MERIMRAQALRDAKAASLMKSPRTLELNAAHPIVRSLAARVVAHTNAAGDPAAEGAAAEGAAAEGAAAEGSSDDGSAEVDIGRAVELLYEAALIGSGFVLEEPSAFIGRVRCCERGEALGCVRALTLAVVPSQVHALLECHLVTDVASAPSGMAEAGGAAAAAA
eukprot:4321185-Prymnesium_polylepis.1